MYVYTKVLSSSSVESVNSDLSKMTTEDVLVKEEEKEVGVVRFSVYKAYWSSVGHLLAPTILLALLFMQGQLLMTHAISSPSAKELAY